MIKIFKTSQARTIILALLATATFVGSAIFMFDVQPQVMLSFFLVSLLGLTIVISAALLFAGLRIALRYFFER